MNRHTSWKLMNAVIVISTLFLLFCYFNNRSITTQTDRPPDAYSSAPPQKHEELRFGDSFEGFNNETGCHSLIVPNIVHFLRFQLSEFRFIDAICILAAVKNQKPDKIYIHTDTPNFKGKYWQYLLRNSEFNRIYEINTIEYPDSIFGQRLSSNYRLTHASDIVRIQILLKFGGIFLDNDSYLVQSLDEFRKFEMTLNWDEDQFLGTQTLVAHPKARFLSLWLDSYRNNYKPDDWYYNAGEYPTKNILYSQPYLVHRVKEKFGTSNHLFEMIYLTLWPQWRSYYYALHLLINHRHYLDPQGFNKIKEFDEINYANDDNTIREMISDVMEWSIKK